MIHLFVIFLLGVFIVSAAEPETNSGPKKPMKLLELLVERKLLLRQMSEKDITNILDLQENKHPGVFIGAILLEQGKINRANLEIGLREQAVQRVLYASALADKLVAGQKLDDIPEVFLGNTGEPNSPLKVTTLAEAANNSANAALLMVALAAKSSTTGTAMAARRGVDAALRLTAQPAEANAAKEGVSASFKLTTLFASGLDLSGGDDPKASAITLLNIMDDALRALAKSAEISEPSINSYIDRRFKEEMERAALIHFGKSTAAAKTTETVPPQPAATAGKANTR